MAINTKNDFTFESDLWIAPVGHLLTLPPIFIVCFETLTATSNCQPNSNYQ